LAHPFTEIAFNQSTGGTRVPQFLLSLPTHENSVTSTTTMLSRPFSRFSTTTADEGLSVPPLDEGRFKGSFRHFCLTKRLTPDQELLRIGGREVKLHSLHEAFIKHRGYDPGEKGPDFWVKIATELDFVQSHDVEPASSEAVDRIVTIYERYLQDFDEVYVMSYREVVEKRRADARSTG